MFRWPAIGRIVPAGARRSRRSVPSRPHLPVIDSKPARGRAPAGEGVTSGARQHECGSADMDTVRRWREARQCVAGNVTRVKRFRTVAQRASFTIRLRGTESTVGASGPARLDDQPPTTHPAEEGGSGHRDAGVKRSRRRNSKQHRSTIRTSTTRTTGLDADGSSSNALEAGAPKHHGIAFRRDTHRRHQIGQPLSCDDVGKAQAALDSKRQRVKNPSSRGHQ
jgi:hypothetical protein